MYICQKDYITNLRKNMRGGSGEAIIENITQENLPKNTRLLAKITLNKDCSIGYHIHENETEIFYFLSGKGFINDNGTEKEALAGDVLITPSCCGHSVSNIHDSALVFIAAIISD